MKLAHRPLWFTVLTGVVCCALQAADQPNEDAVKVFMRVKLDASEEILEGLVTRNFDAIESGADQLHVLSQRAAWNALTTAEYVQYSAEFQRHARRMGDAARGEDLDAAALAYVQMTLTCVNCHKHVRGVKVAELSPWRRAVAHRVRRTVEPAEPE